MDQADKTFAPALAHGDIEDVFSDVFVVSGAMETVLMDMDWKFSRNMTVVKDGDRLVLINAVRLDENGLASLEKLGKVTDVMRLGALHGRDDAFYLDRYGATYWTLPGLDKDIDSDAVNTRVLSEGGPLPINNASVFLFQTTQIPEAIIRLERDGGILIACDALQNWISADEHFCDASRERMEGMGFFTPANVGPVWMQAAAPGAEDFKRLGSMTFQHALCGHGKPVRDNAHEAYTQTFDRLFGH
ncbi:hypothetical protein [Marinobacter halotolerans]|uniref:hypothetical protein n=1 Tax=Marinobacter halotolerans TaxID=1569211 RepID=UPI00124479F9|nr:hypothetical protein [Marinobacter halotolerans]